MINSTCFLTKLYTKSAPAKQFHKQFTNPPNFFLSVRITEKDILSKVQNVQKHIQTRCPKVQKQCYTQLQKLHMTLFVLYIDDSNALEAVHEVFKEIPNVVQKFYSKEPPKLKLKGVGSFGTRVVFMQLEENVESKTFMQFVEDLRKVFKDKLPKEGVNLEDKAFVPHITLVKMRNRNEGIIPSEAFSSHVSLEFGHQTIGSIELSSMHHKDNDGYYKCLGRFHFHNQFIEKIQFNPFKSPKVNKWMEADEKNNSVYVVKK